MREGEATVHAYLESASQAVLGVDANGEIILANAMAEQIFGYPREELLGKTIETLMPEPFRGQHVSHRARFFSEPRRRTMGAGLDLRARRKDGSVFPIHVNLSHIDAPKGRTALAFVSDISDRVAAQENLREIERLRVLTAGLFRGQEQERRRISRELHDGLNQKLAALSMDLDALQDETLSREAADGRFSAIEERIMAVANEVRRISHQLHPSILEHAGLVAALRSYCREFFKLAQIETIVTAEDVPESVDPVVATALYHLSQEALQNVAKHSGATEVRVSITGTMGGIELSFLDNGNGFDLAQAQAEGGLGLLSMNERARSLGGRFSVDTQPGEGAKVTVWAPLDQPMPDP